MAQRHSTPTRSKSKVSDQRFAAGHESSPKNDSALKTELFTIISEPDINLIQSIEDVFIVNNSSLRITYKAHSELLPYSIPIVSKCILIRELKFILRNLENYKSIEISNSEGELIFTISHI
ncbi:hypothetical protein AB1F87_004013 [Vibrio mimicus]